MVSGTRRRVRSDGEICAIRADMRVLGQKIDGVDRELRTAIDIRERLAAVEARRAS